MYTPDLAPIGGSLLWSSLIAVTPLLTVFVTLGVLKWKAHWAGLSALAVALVVAVAAYGMPLHLAALSATQGFAFGLFPIMWIVLNAIWLYEVTVKSGRFEDLRQVIDTISHDPRIQAIIIAFCFGGLLEALAGFGAPVAITGVMLMSIGFGAMRAAVVVLIANTAPVAFGAIATPIITAGTLTGIPYTEIAAVVGRQTPLLALLVPLLLVLIADGRRGLRDVWPFALAVGAAFAVAQFVSANWISPELTDVIAALVGLAVAVLMLRVWSPRNTGEARERMLAARDTESPDGLDGSAPSGPSGGVAVRDRVDHALRPRTVMMALFPYLLIIVVFSLAKLWTPAKSWLASYRCQIRLAGPGREHPAQRPERRRPQRSTRWAGCPRPAPCCCCAASWWPSSTGVSAADTVKVYGATVAQAEVRDPDRRLGAGAGLRDEPVRADHHDRRLDRRYRCRLRLPLADPRLARHGRDGFRHQRQRAVRHPAADRGPAGGPRPHPAGGRQHLRRCGRQDDQPAEPHDRRHGGGNARVVNPTSSARSSGWSLGMLIVLCLLVGLQSSVLSWMLP